MTVSKAWASLLDQSPSRRQACGQELTCTLRTAHHQRLPAAGAFPQ